jgi:hypothetical protein
MPVPSIKVTVRLSFSNGEETVQTVESPGTPVERGKDRSPEYFLSDATAPLQPTLVDSRNFIRIS